MRSSSSTKKSRQSEHKVRFIHWKDIVGSNWFLGSLAIPVMFGETSYAGAVSEEMIMIATSRMKVIKVMRQHKTTV